MTDRREPHIYTPAHDSCRCCFVCGRPFDSYQPQPDTAERKRLEVQAIPFALPEKKPTHEERVESWKALLMMMGALPEKRDDR